MLRVLLAPRAVQWPRGRRCRGVCMIFAAPHRMREPSSAFANARGTLLLQRISDGTVLSRISTLAISAFTSSFLSIRSMAPTRLPPQWASSTFRPRNRVHRSVHRIGKALHNGSGTPLMPARDRSHAIATVSAMAAASIGLVSPRRAMEWDASSPSVILDRKCLRASPEPASPRLGNPPQRHHSHFRFPVAKQRHR